MPLLRDKKLVGLWLGLSYGLCTGPLAPPQAGFPALLLLLILSENPSIACLGPAIGPGFGQD